MRPRGQRRARDPYRREAATRASRRTPVDEPRTAHAAPSELPKQTGASAHRRVRPGYGDDRGCARGGGASQLVDARRYPRSARCKWPLRMSPDRVVETVPRTSPAPARPGWRSSPRTGQCSEHRVTCGAGARADIGDWFSSAASRRRSRPGTCRSARAMRGGRTGAAAFAGRRPARLAAALARGDERPGGREPAEATVLAA